MVGGRRTLVRAIDMRTFGLGGDSEVDFENDGRVTLRTNRIVPASLLASRHPSVLRHMRRVLADPEGEPYAGRFLVRPFGHDGGAVAAELTVRERDMLDLVQGEPIPMKDAVKGPSNHRALDRLVGLGLLQVSGFTPSDAAHVLGLQGQWLREGAVLAGALFKRWRRMSPSLDSGNAEAFARELRRRCHRRRGGQDRPRHHGDAGGRPLDGAAAPLVEAVVSGAGRLRGLSVAIGPVSPVVAVGGPAGVYYPQVGERLGCAIVLPEHGDVANAVGAAVGVVKAQAVVEISSQGMGAWRIHADGEPIPVADPGEALARARAMAEDAARAGALAMGATHPVVEVHIDRVDLPDMQGDRGLIAATIIAESWGAPKAVEERA